MKMIQLKRLLLGLSLLWVTTASANAELRVAVAANFLGTMQELARHYRAHSGQSLMLSSGSSGAFYTQIHHGAPFDVFFSADSRRPERLVADGMALEASRFTYAVGVPVLWSSNPDRVDSNGTVLSQGDFRHLSIAEPRNAPYGAAAQQVLQEVGVWETLTQERRLIRAQSIGQAYSQVASGAAPLGFVALSQVKAEDGSIPGSYWIPPAKLYDPIAQQAVILTDTQDLQAAQDFLSWMRAPQATAIIEAAGYSVPH